MRSSLGSSSPPRSAFTHTSITIQATRPRSPFVEVVGEGFKPSLGMRSSTGSSSPPPGSAFTHTSITIQPHDPVTVSRRCRGGFQTLPRQAIKHGVVFSPAQCIHPHLYHSRTCGNQGPRILRWKAHFLSPSMVDLANLCHPRIKSPSQGRAYRLPRVPRGGEGEKGWCVAGAGHPCNDSLVDTRTGRRAAHTRRPVPR